LSEIEHGEVGGERRQGHDEGGDGHQHGGDDELQLQRRRDAADGLDLEQVRGEERGDQADEEPRGADEQRVGHRREVVVGAERGDGRDEQRRAGGLGVGAEQVGPHPGDVADVVAHVVRDHRGVPRVVLGDVALHLPDEVRAHVRRLGVDAAADAPEQRHRRPAEAVARDGLVQALPVVAVVEPEHLDGDVEHEEAEGGQEEAHDGARPERRGERRADATPSFQGGPGVRVRGDPHAEVPGHHGGGGAEEEGHGAEHRVCQRGLAGATAGVLARPAISAEPVNGAQEEEDHHGEDRRERGEVLVLCEKE